MKREGCKSINQTSWQSRPKYKKLGVYDLFRAAQNARWGRNNFDSIQMVSQSFMSGGWVEFSDPSTPWAIAQIQDSIPPILLGNTVVEVFLSTGFD
ncbi:hypothetical protein TNIN_85861 [Trichonephila inaurata madagascariensis]|uniref:Uncharacterized protein n=1 Tax=Trichonephila inaurata madagascariensis TaxID=2747483 RepID=A0A8X6YPG6_9ARAC|nr:hypothetical protein TNIN_85861 [Trichonephila inaurata madagascariensis]